MNTFSQLTPEEKFQRVLEEITDELKVTPKGQPLEIHRGHETDVAIGERHYQKIIAKLEQEENTIKVLPDNRKEGTYSDQWGYPSRFARLEVVNAGRLFEMLDEHTAITGLSADSLNLKIHKAAALWGMPESERKLHAIAAIDFSTPKTTTALNKPAIQKDAAIKKNILWAAYDPNKGVIINDLFIIKKPHAGSENERVMEFLIKNPNKEHTFEAVQTAINKKLTKGFYDIARGLGFEGNLMKLFFPKISNSVIKFINPVMRSDMDALSITHIPVNIGKSNKSEENISKPEEKQKTLKHFFENPEKTV